MEKTNTHMATEVTTRPNTPSSAITIRESFAAVAMQGLLSGSRLPWDGEETYPEGLDSVTERAVDCADSLIRALNRIPATK